MRLRLSNDLVKPDTARLLEICFVGIRNFTQFDLAGSGVP
jgi:hypothetical protein